MISYVAQQGMLTKGVVYVCVQPHEGYDEMNIFCSYGEVIFLYSKSSGGGLMILSYVKTWESASLVSHTMILDAEQIMEKVLGPLNKKYRSKKLQNIFKL